MPDYTKSVQDVYIEWFLDVTRNLEHPEVAAGGGIGAGVADTLGLPSWLSNLANLTEFAEHSAYDLPVDAGFTDLLGAFRVDGPKLSQNQTCLEIRGVKCDELSIVRREILSNDYRAHWAFVALGACSTRDDSGRRLSRLRIPILQAIFRLLFLDKHPETGRGRLNISDPASHRLAISFVGWILRYKDPSTPYEAALRSLGFEPDKSFGSCYREVFFPDADSRWIPDSWDVSTSLAALQHLREDPQHPDVFAVEQHILLSGIGRRKPVLTTKLNHLGIGPRGMQVGDMICVLDQIDSPVLLRNVEGRMKLVGACFVLGLSANATKDSLRKREREIQDFHIY